MSKFARNAGIRLFEKHLGALDQYTPVDPLYEVEENGRRRKRAIPPGLSKRDEAILKAVRKRAHYLDKGFSICGMRFGWTFVIGIIPGAGDAADAVLNYVLVVRKARQAELPGWLLSQMLFNNTVSICVGLIPLAGDVVLAVWKANSRNAALLEEFLRIRGGEFLKDQEDRINEEVVMPGAGCEPGEVVTGKGEAPARSGTGGGWFRRNKGSKKGKRAETAAAPSRSSPPPSKGRFIEGD